MKVAIISSHREACGPAAYSKYLAEQLKTDRCEIVICALDVYLLRLDNKIAKRQCKLHLASISKTANQCDMILWQFEPGLLSSFPRMAYARAIFIFRRLELSKLTVTLHGFDRPSRIYRSVRMLFRFSVYLRAKTLFRMISDVELVFSPAYHLFFFKLKKVRVVCFSRHDVKELRLFKKVDSSYLPISYLPAPQISELLDRREGTRERWLAGLGIKTEEKVVVCPGFISTYKNGFTVLKASEYLPDNYHVVFAGGLHPHALDTSPYFEAMQLFDLYPELKLAFERKHETFLRNSLNAFLTGLNQGNVQATGTRESSLSRRIHFTGNLGDEELCEIIAAADCVLIPYLNTLSGQSGSGPFAFAVELAKAALFSSAQVFVGQDFISPMDFHVVNATGYKEMAYKLKNLETVERSFKKFRAKFRKSYTCENQSSFYLSKR